MNAATSARVPRRILEQQLAGATKEIDSANTGRRSAEHALIALLQAHRSVVGAIDAQRTPLTEASVSLSLNLDDLATCEPGDVGDNLLEAKRAIRRLYDAIDEIAAAIHPAQDWLAQVDAAAQFTPTSATTVINLDDERAKRKGA